MTSDYNRLERECKEQGFKSLTDYLLDQKRAKSPLRKKNKVKASDIGKGNVVGFTAQGHQIVACKSTQRGTTTIKCYLTNDNLPLLATETRRTFATVKEMVSYINSTLIDEDATNKLAWW